MERVILKVLTKSKLLKVKTKPTNETNKDIEHSPSSKDDEWKIISPLMILLGLENKEGILKEDVKNYLNHQATLPVKIITKRNQN